jgi:hypothetical protein
MTRQLAFAAVFAAVLMGGCFYAVLAIVNDDSAADW